MVNPAEKGGISANKSISQPHTGRQPGIENWASLNALKLLKMISTAANIYSSGTYSYTSIRFQGARKIDSNRAKKTCAALKNSK